MGIGGGDLGRFFRPGERLEQPTFWFIAVVGSRDHALVLPPFLLQELERVLSYELVRAAPRVVPILMTTQSSTPRLWDAPMVFAP